MWPWKAKRTLTVLCFKRLTVRYPFERIKNSSKAFDKLFEWFAYLFEQFWHPFEVNCNILSNGSCIHLNSFRICLNGSRIRSNDSLIHSNGSCLHSNGSCIYSNSCCICSPTTKPIRRININSVRTVSTSILDVHCITTAVDIKIIFLNIKYWLGKLLPRSLL